MKKKKRRPREDILHFEGYKLDVGNKLTFIGVLQSCLDEIKKDWKDVNTRKTYYGHYEDHLFPLIPEKPLEDLTEADFETVIETLIEQGIKENNPYSEGQIRHHRHLLRVVTKAADKAGVCPDVLWGGKFQENESPEHEAKIKVKPRSLSTGEEYEICERVMKDPTEDGELVGIAIMYSLGTRNQEACGLNWECFIYSEGDNMGFLRIVGSTEQGSNQLKAGGKTFNAPRILPVTGFLLTLLAERKRWLEEKYDAPNENDGLNDSLGNLPIVCRGQALNIRCSADDLTRRAKALLKDIELDEDVLEEANELLDQRFANAYGERDVTAYLFRRNFATHMVILGMDSDTIHYLMGHVFDDEEVTKARYTNGDMLRQIGERMRQRPIINQWLDNKADIVTLSGNQSISGTANGPTVFTINPEGKTATVIGFLKPKGAAELKISLEYEAVPESGEIILTPEKLQIESKVSELVTYRRIYSRQRKKQGIESETEQTIQSSLKTKGQPQ